MRQPELRLCITLYIFFIARENVFGLKSHEDCSNYDSLQNKQMTSEIVNENEKKFYNLINDDKYYTNDPEINKNSIDLIRDGLINYKNIETDEKAKINRRVENINDCLYEGTENECSEHQNLVESVINDNLTHVYIAGIDDSLMDLKRNIQKYGKGHELRVCFYLYKNQKCYDLGYLYTDAYILQYFIPNCENYFCIDNQKNNWCFDNLSRKHYMKDFNIQTESLKFAKEFENNVNQPTAAELKNLWKLKEYVPTEVAGHYELNIPEEQQYMDENILDNFNQNNFRMQNTNINNNIPQTSSLKPEVLESLKTVKNNKIDYSEKEENNLDTLKFVAGGKVCYKQDVNMLGEAINNKDDIASNDFTYDDTNREYIIDSMDTIKNDEITYNNENLFKSNENYLNYIPINTLSNKESDYNYSTHPCSSKYSAKENDPAQTEFGHNLQYDDATATKQYDKCLRTNDAFSYDPKIPNISFTPRYIGGIKTIVTPLSVGKPLKLIFFPYQTHLIPNLLAKNNDMVFMNKNDANFEIVDRTFDNNEPILTRPQASGVQQIENVIQGYVPIYDLENQIQSPPTPYEEATLTNNNIINDVQSPIKQETYLKMSDIENDGKRNCETLTKFNIDQNKIPWNIKYIPNETNMWQIFPNIQKQLVSDSLNTPRELNKDELLTNLQSKSLIAKSLPPCINTNNYDIRAKPNKNFLVPQNEKKILYDTKPIFLNTDDTDKSEEERISLEDNINNGLPRTNYFIQDPCTYKNLKSLVGIENSFLSDTYYTPTSNFQNNNMQIIDKSPYNSDLTKKTFKLKYYPYSIALCDTSVQKDMGKVIASSIRPNTINFEQSVENAYENILVPETNLVTTQNNKNPFNTLLQYKQYCKIPSRILYTPLSYSTFPSKIVRPKPLTSNKCHSNAYLGSNIKTVNQPFTYPVLYKSVAYQNQDDKTLLIPTIVENKQPIYRINDISQKNPIQFSDNVDTNNFHINPFVPQNQNLEDSMYSVDPTTRNTACFKKLFENAKPIVVDVPSKSVTSDSSYVPFPIVTNFATSENKYPIKMPFAVDLQESTSASILQPIPTYNLLNYGPNTDNLNSYIDQTPQDETNSYNTNVQNTIRPAVSPYTAHPTSSLFTTSYFQPTVTYSGNPLQNGHTSNLYHEKLENILFPNSISQVFPKGFTSKTSEKEILKFLKRQNINDFCNKNIKSRLQETQMNHQLLQKKLNYEPSSMSMPAKLSPYVGNLLGPSVFVEETDKLRNNIPNHQIKNFEDIPLRTTENDNGNYIINKPTVKIENLANTNPEFHMTNIGENEILTSDYPAGRQDPMSKFYDVCECKQNYFNKPFQLGKVPEYDQHEYMQYSREPQELLNTEPASTLTYYLPVAKLLPVKTTTMNKGFVHVPTKVLLNTNIVQPLSSSTNSEYSIIPNHKYYIPQLYLPSDNTFTDPKTYQSNTIPVEGLESTYFDTPHTDYNLKYTYKNSLKSHKEKILDGFYTTSPPAVIQEEIKSSRNENFIDYNNIENDQKVRIYSQPCMRILNYNKDILQTAITPKKCSANTNVQKNSVIENNSPDGYKLTVPSNYNSDITKITPKTRKYDYVLNKIFNVPTFATTEPSLDVKLTSQVTTRKTNENGEIILKEIPEGNQGPITFGNIRYSKPEYQIRMPKNMHQGQDIINIFNNIPEIKQNYLESPSNLGNFNFLRSFYPRTTERATFNNIFNSNIEPSSNLQYNGNPINLTPYFTRDKKPSSINDVVYPFTIKPSLAQKQSIQEAVSQIVNLNEPNTPSIPKVYENLNFGVDSRGPQRIVSVKQSSNLYYDPVDLNKLVSAVHDIGNTEQDNGFISCTSGELNPISGPFYVPEKEICYSATTKNLYQYLKPTSMKINKHFKWSSKLENYMSPFESYNEQKYNMQVPSDYTPMNIETDFITKTTQNSKLLNTPNYVFLGHNSGNTPLSNKFNWNFNLQSKDAPDTTLYSSYTKYPNTLTSLYGYERPGADYDPATPLTSDLNSQINYNVHYTSIPHKNPSISPSLADIISPYKNIFFNIQNAFKKTIKQDNEYLSAETGQSYYVNDNTQKALPNIKQFPITPTVQYEKYPKHNVLLSKYHDSPQIVNSKPSHVTYNVKAIPMQRSQSLYFNTDDSKYASWNLLYPKNVYSYPPPIPKVSNQNIVNPLLSYKYLTKGVDISPPHMLCATTKPFSTVKTREGIPIWNNLASQNSRFTEYNRLPQNAPWKKSLPLTEVNFNSIPNINSFSPMSQTYLSSITSLTNPTVSSDRIFNKNDHVPQVVNSDYNMITQNIGAFQSNVIPILLPSNVRQTNMESEPLVESTMSFTNEIPTIQPLFDFSSETEPQRLISNKTSSKILKSNNDLVNPEQIYSEQGKISFIPQINSYYYDVKRNYFRIHSNERNHQKTLRKIDANIYTIEDNNYSDLRPVQNRMEKRNYEILPSITQIEKQRSNYNYNKINPFLKSQSSDLNYSFNLETKPEDCYKFDKIISSNVCYLPASVTNINTFASLKPSRLYSRYASTYHRMPNIYTHTCLPKYENSLSDQNPTLLNSIKTLACTRSEHTLFKPPVSTVLKSSTYPILTNDGTELFRSNLNTVYEYPSMITFPKSYLSSPTDWSSYVKSNRPLYKSIQHQNPAMYHSTDNAIWNSDSEKYSVYKTCPTGYSFKQTNSLPDITSNGLAPHIQFNSASTSNIPIQQTWKQNVQGFIKSAIENFNEENPLVKTLEQEENSSNEPILSQIDEASNVMEAQNYIYENKRYYQAMPKIVIAKYEPSGHNTFVIKTDNCNLKLKTWRSKLKVITPMLVYSVKEIPTINFMPIRTSEYTTENDMENAKKYVAQKYGVPTVIKGVYNTYKPYAYISDSSNLRDNMPVIWPSFCTCGCCQSGCCCTNK